MRHDSNRSKPQASLPVRPSYEVLNTEEGEATEGEEMEPVGDEEFEDKSDVEATEEGIEAKIMSKPIEPTQEEIDRHMTTHIPFRSWCPHCVMGEGKEQQTSKEKGVKR